MPKRTAIAVAAVLFLAAPVRAAEAPEAIVRRFYASILKAQPSGCPAPRR